MAVYGKYQVYYGKIKKNWRLLKKKRDILIYQKHLHIGIY